MNKQKLKQFMESQGYEEISLEDYFESKQKGLIQVGIVGESLSLCFKPKDNTQGERVTGHASQSKSNKRDMGNPDTKEKPQETKRCLKESFQEEQRRENKELQAIRKARSEK